MTVSTTVLRAPFNGNDVATSFPFTFKVFDESDIELTHIDDEGTRTVLDLDVDYSVTLNADQNTNPGGSITYPLSGDPLPTGESLVALSTASYEQPSSFANLTRFLPRTHENAIDRAVLLIKQLAEKFSRAVVAPVGDTADMTLPTPQERGDTVLGFDATSKSPVASSFTMTQLASTIAAAYAGAAGPLDALTFIQALSDAVSRTAQDKSRDFVHAKDYGVTGNGVTVETTELQTAINRSVTLGKELRISGTPLIDDTITIPDSARIFFDGGVGNFDGLLPQSYILKKNTGVSYVGVLVSGQSAHLYGGGVVGQAGNAGDNIQWTGACSRWEHLFSSGAGNDGLRIGKDGSGLPNANKFYLSSPCCVANGRDGIHIHDNTGGAPNANAGTINAPFLQDNGRHGLYGNNSFANTVVGILTESNVGKGIYLDESAVAWTFYGGDVEQNTSAAGVAGSDIVLATSIIAAGGQKGNHQFYGTITGTPPTDNVHLTGRGWVVVSGFGTASGAGTINGEGTCSLVLKGLGTAGTFTGVTNTCIWTKHGREVKVLVNYSHTGMSVAPVGQLVLDGLPFAPLSDACGFAAGRIDYLVTPSIVSQPTVGGDVSGTQFRLRGCSTTNNESQPVLYADQGAGFQTACRIQGVLTYYTAD